MLSNFCDIVLSVMETLMNDNQRLLRRWVRALNMYFYKENGIILCKRNSKKIFFYVTLYFNSTCTYLKNVFWNGKCSCSLSLSAESDATHWFFLYMRLPFVNMRDIFKFHNIYVKLQNNYVIMHFKYLIINDDYDNMQKIISTCVLYMSTCDYTM